MSDTKKEKGRFYAMAERRILKAIGVSTDDLEQDEEFDKLHSLRNCLMDYEIFKSVAVDRAISDHIRILNELRQIKNDFDNEKINKTDFKNYIVDRADFLDYKKFERKLEKYYGFLEDEYMNYNTVMTLYNLLISDKKMTLKQAITKLKDADNV